MSRAGGSQRPDAAGHSGALPGRRSISWACMGVVGRFTPLVPNQPVRSLELTAEVRPSAVFARFSRGLWLNRGTAHQWFDSGRRARDWGGRGSSSAKPQAVDRSRGLGTNRGRARQRAGSSSRVRATTTMDQGKRTRAGSAVKSGASAPPITGGVRAGGYQAGFVCTLEARARNRPGTRLSRTAVRWPPSASPRNIIKKYSVGK